MEKDLQAQMREQLDDTNQKYLQLSKKIEETLSKCRNTLSGIDKTLENSQKARTNYVQTMDKIDKMQSDFKKALDKFADNIAQSFKVHTFRNPPLQQEQQPKVINAKQGYEILKNKKNICFLTGAGISVSSGIPTFRGDGGLWTKGDKTFDAQSVATKQFFDKEQTQYWQWHNGLLNKIMKGKPNKSHESIAKLMVFGETSKKKDICIVTQNIDNYHIDSYLHLTQTIKKDDQILTNELSNIFEIHGNMLYLRCDKDCNSTVLYQDKQLGSNTTNLQACPQCQGRMRPHVLMFDEAYSERYSQIQSVFERLKKIDCLVVVGTMLETSGASQIVGNALLDQNIAVFEINPNPIILSGENVFTIKGNSDDVLPQICQI